MTAGKKTQRERFEETAPQLGADESDEALYGAMDRLDLRAKPQPEKASLKKD